MRCALLALLLQTVICHATFAQTAIDQSRVDRLVQQLGSPSRRDRETAEAALIQAGPAILDLLPAKPREAASLAAFERIQLTLQQAAAREAGRASRLTRNGVLSHTQISRVVREQTRQTVRITPRDVPTPIKVDWNETLFWDAIGDLEAATKTRVAGDAAGNELLLQPDSRAMRPPSATSGPCRVELLSGSRRPNLVDPTNSIVQVRWCVRTEPRLRPLYLIVADGECSLSDGRTRYEPLSPDARREIPCDRWTGCEIDTPFQAPGEIPLDRLQFGVDALLKVAAIPLQLRFDDLDQPLPASRRQGPVTGVVRNVRFDRESGLLTVDVTVTYDRGGPEFESHRMWIHQNAAWLKSKDGSRTVTGKSVELLEIARSGATLRYEFENVQGFASDYAFVYEAPSLVIDVPISVRGLKLAGEDERGPDDPG